MDATASKRKRDTLASEDEHSPKRRRSPLPGTYIDDDASDEQSPEKNIRRKKGFRNLSNLNLRHAAEQQKAPKKKSRKSRFIEGSFGDKPIEKPPSMFMRFIRTDSGNIKQVTVAQEGLMEEYHDEMSEPRSSVDKVIAQEKAAIPDRVAQIDADKENKNDGGMFGKWHPVALWNKVFAQTREEIIREDFEAAERKAREEEERKAQDEAERKAEDKADFERRYFEMKAAGMFKPKYIGPNTGPAFASVSSRNSTHEPRDSGISIDDDSDMKESDEQQPSTSYNTEKFKEDQRAASQMSGLESEARESSEYQRSTSYNTKDSKEDQRSTSQKSALLPPPQADTTSASDVPETASKPAKTLKSRLHLRKPSLTSLTTIQGSLKRAKSEWSLTQTLHHRESSSSISPVKTDFENSELKKSHSKYDLKKQHKLSKRVSDLESKLSQARKELDTALVDASPMPKLGSRYERFTPSNTLKRPKFIPGKLPSLPSERILMAQQQQEQEETATKVKEDEEMGDVEPNNDDDLEEFLAEAQVKKNNDEDDEETIKARAPPNNRHQYPTRGSSLFSLNNTNIEQQATESTEPTEPAEPIEPTEPARPVTAFKILPDISDLTEPTTSQIEEMDPNSITDDTTTNGAIDQTTNPPDYADLDAKLKALDANVKTAAKAKKPASKTKKRKSGDDMDKVYKPGKGKEEDSDWEEEQTPKKKRKGLFSSPKEKKAKKKSPPKKGAKKVDDGKDTAEQVQADIEMLSERTSMDSQMRPLEPVFEEAEEEEMEDTEEQMLTRAAEAAKTNRASVEEPVRMIPGKGDVPALPNGTVMSRKEGKKAGKELAEGFEWPDDVF